MIKYLVDPWIPSVFSPLISLIFILLFSIVVSILSCSIFGWKTQANNYFYLLLNNRGFYISISHSLWIDLRLTEILLLVKNLHLGLYYFSQFLLSEYFGLILDIWVALNIRVALIRFYKNLCLLHTPSITKCNFYFFFLFWFLSFFSTFGVKKTIRYLLLHLSHAMHLQLICKSHKLWSHIKKFKKKPRTAYFFIVKLSSPWPLFLH